MPTAHDISWLENSVNHWNSLNSTDVLPLLKVVVIVGLAREFVRILVESARVKE